MLKVNMQEAKRYVFMTHINDVVLPREESEVMEAFNVIIEPGKCTHLHKHGGNEQVYLVTAGLGKAKFTFANGEKKEFTMQPGDVVHIPRNTEHQIFCMSTHVQLVYFCVDAFVDRAMEKPTWDEHYQASIARYSDEEKAALHL